jgi:hypothetical protein
MSRVVKRSALQAVKSSTSLRGVPLPQFVPFQLSQPVDKPKIFGLEDDGPGPHFAMVKLNKTLTFDFSDSATFDVADYISRTRMDTRLNF